MDTRLLPYVFALALLALDSDDAAIARRLAAAGALFLAARTAGTTLAFVILARGQTQALAAIPALPPGSAVLVLVNQPDMGDWDNPRLDHIDGLALARARVFTNGQWALAGQQLIRPRHPQAAPFDRDPSQLVYPPGASYRPTDFDDAIAWFDRCTFTSVWTVDFPPGRVRAPTST